jgi:hypothetical protein
VLVELGVLTLLVGGGDELVSLVLEPLADTELVLGCTKKLWDLLGVLATYKAEQSASIDAGRWGRIAARLTIVKDEKNFLSVGTSISKGSNLR